MGTVPWTSALELRGSLAGGRGAGDELGGEKLRLLHRIGETSLLVARKELVLVALPRRSWSRGPAPDVGSQKEWDRSGATAAV